MHSSTDEAAILALERPHARLWTYYLLRCLAIPPLLPFTILHPGHSPAIERG